MVESVSQVGTVALTAAERTFVELEGLIVKSLNVQFAALSGMATISIGTLLQTLNIIFFLVWRLSGHR